MNRTNPAPEIEKFLFYRGVGNFPTPLVVRVGGDGGISMTNTGTEPLKHMILLTVSGGSGSYRRVDALKRGAETPSYDLGTGGKLPMAQLRKQVEDTMTEDLVAEGLYLREARAMVNTWRDSWFCEEGTRVLYVLPRKWTDETLPLEMKPTPKELVRVMVGRAEVIMPSVENHLAEEVGMVEKGETGAAERLKHSLRSMGRFGEPALIRAIAQNKVQWDHQSKLYALLRDDKAATALNFE
jgi:hypothetical protein